jgi:hypothetical protein
MKKVILSIAVVSAILAGTNAKAQLIDEQNVTVTMDLQPILQLNMNGSQNVDFVFDQIAEYVGGITQYGATALSISSTVSWDLYAAGFSSAAAGGNLIWDNQVSYGSTTDGLAVTSVPLTALELHQDKANPLFANFTGETADYFTAFVAGSGSIGQNNVYATATPYTRPTNDVKYIAGGADDVDFVAGGTYLVTNASGTGAQSNYYYTIDYRIVPGLPAVFPNASDENGLGGGNNTTASTTINAAGGEYARPGVYTMNVKYVLVEN